MRRHQIGRVREGWILGIQWDGLKYPPVLTNSLLLKMAIDLVSCPNKKDTFPWLWKRLPDVNKDEIYAML